MIDISSGQYNLEKLAAGLAPACAKQLYVVIFPFYFASKELLRRELAVSCDEIVKYASRNYNYNHNLYFS